MTYVILAHPYHDPAADAFRSAITKFCNRGDSAHRVDENVHAPKGRPDAVYLCAFTSFDRASFVALVQAVPWAFPTGVSAMVRVHGNQRFESIDLSMEYDVGRQAKLAAAAGWNVDPADQQREFFDSVYPRLLERRRALIRDSLSNPLRHFESFNILESITSVRPWSFECVAIQLERFMIQSSRRELGPGANDQKMVATKHRMVSAHLAYRGIHAALFCDSADVGNEVFEQVKSQLLLLQIRETLMVDGTIDIRASGELHIQKICRVERAANA